MISRPCPICRIGKIWRKEQRTCSDHCSRTWRQMTPTQQAMSVERSFDVLEHPKLSSKPLSNEVHMVNPPGPDDLDDEESLTPEWLK